MGIEKKPPSQEAKKQGINIRVTTRTPRFRELPSSSIATDEDANLKPLLTLLLAYFSPFDRQGRLDLFLLLVHCETYLFRNVFALAVFLLLYDLTDGLLSDVFYVCSLPFTFASSFSAGAVIDMWRYERKHNRDDDD